MCLLESPDFIRNADLAASPDRRIRLASSTPDVKALFNNSPSYVYKLPEHEEQDESHSGFGGEYWPSLGPPPMVRILFMNAALTYPVADSARDTASQFIDPDTERTPRNEDPIRFSKPRSKSKSLSRGH
jgi:hypothetical protein